MPKGNSIHLGLNRVDPSRYAGWDGVLKACEADAVDMKNIAEREGFRSKVLLTSDATRSAVWAELADSASVLHAGDILLLTYSGHGGQLPDRDGDEPDSMDETWCLYDGQVLDDEINELLGRFEKGVRLLVVSDSCHSGSVARASLVTQFSQARVAIAGRFRELVSSEDSVVFRSMPADVARSVYQANKDFYDGILSSPSLSGAKDRVKASGILLSGCQDNQLSQDGVFNGAFTSHLKAVWRDGAFVGDYEAFHRMIVHSMNRTPEQTPQLSFVGDISASFLRQRPFTV